jgi:hypothetical protein
MKGDGMKTTHPVYSMAWHKPESLLRLTWKEGTEGMTDEDFRQTLEAFAEGAAQHRAARLLIDVRQFKHRPSREILAWRDRVTVAKYNLAGVKRQAWVWPGDVSGLKPSSEGRSYEERYFSTEEEALVWLIR